MQSPHAPVRPDWLALIEEVALEPERAIVDAHHHLWDRPGQRYLADDYRADLNSGHRVVASVYVQCRSMFNLDYPEPMQPVGEVEFANGVAAHSASGLFGEMRMCAGIIGAADLLLGDAVARVLDAMQQRAGERFRGVRNTTAWHADARLVSNPKPPPPGILGEQRFKCGVKHLVARDLSLDIWAYHTQLEEVIALAQACPDLLIIVNHLGGPLGAGPYAGKRQAVFAQWAALLKRLAALPNVRMKLGGLGMKVVGFDLHTQPLPPGSEQLAALWKPYLLHAIECFGVERCLFESNFPVDKGMFSYGVLWNAFKRVVADFSDAEKDRLFSSTARELYLNPR